MRQILEGIKILDFTQFKTGPMGTQLLADLGAEVIKVERPLVGDYERDFAAFGKCTAKGASPFFLAMNRNKKSLAIDLKAPQAKEIIYRLVEKADVVSQNFRPGVMEKLGFGYEDLKKIKPDIIYCSNSGYGLTGPYLKRPGQDLLAQAISGVIMTNGTEERPTSIATSVADGVTSIYLAFAILSALYYKKCTGEGQNVDVDLLSSMIAFQQEEISAFFNINPTPDFKRSSTGLTAPWNGAPYGMYKTKDNKYMVLATCPLDKLGKIIGEDRLDQYKPGVEAFEHRDELREMIQAKLIENTREYWLKLLLSQDVWCAQVNDFTDMAADPQVQHNKMIQKMVHPKWGEISVVATPIRYSETPAQYKTAPPDIGENSIEILKSIGFANEEIKEMVEKAVVDAPKNGNPYPG